MWNSIMGMSVNCFDNVVDQFALTSAIGQQNKSTQVYFPFSFSIFLSTLKGYVWWLDDIQNVRITREIRLYIFNLYPQDLDRGRWKTVRTWPTILEEAMAKQKFQKNLEGAL